MPLSEGPAINSHAPHASLQLSIKPLSIERTEFLLVHNGRSSDYTQAGRRRRLRRHYVVFVTFTLVLLLSGSSVSFAIARWQWKWFHSRCSSAASGGGALASTPLCRARPDSSAACPTHHGRRSVRLGAPPGGGRVRQVRQLLRQQTFLSAGVRRVFPLQRAFLRAVHAAAVRRRTRHPPRGHQTHAVAAGAAGPQGGRRRLDRAPVRIRYFPATFGGQKHFQVSRTIAYQILYSLCIVFVWFEQGILYR